MVLEKYKRATILDKHIHSKSLNTEKRARNIIGLCANTVSLMFASTTPVGASKNVLVKQIITSRKFKNKNNILKIINILLCFVKATITQ